MLTKEFLNELECKVSDDGHIVNDPICLPCGYSACRRCYEIRKFCLDCKEEHVINKEQLKTHKLIKDKVEKNIQELTIIVKEKLEKYSNSIIGNLN